MILEIIDIDIDKAILQNIDIDKISNQFKFGISNRAKLYNISLLSGYGNLAQGGDSIYRGVDYKRCSGGPNLPNQARFLANLTCPYKFLVGKQKNTTIKTTF